MTVVHMIRHGEAEAAYSEHPDPGLSPLGQQQAKQVADVVGNDRPLAVISSPMARARQTAAPLADRWGVPLSIEPAVSEIPSPGLTPAARGPWLQAVMASTWDAAPEEVRAWRDGIADFLLSLETDAVVFSHFVAINAALSVATGSNQPRVAHLDHCSVSTFGVDQSALRVIQTGEQGVTTIL